MPDKRRPHILWTQSKPPIHQLWMRFKLQSFDLFYLPNWYPQLINTIQPIYTRVIFNGLYSISCHGRLLNLSVDLTSSWPSMLHCLDTNTEYEKWLKMRTIEQLLSRRRERRGEREHRRRFANELRDSQHGNPGTTILFKIETSNAHTERNSKRCASIFKQHISQIDSYE